MANKKVVAKKVKEKTMLIKIAGAVGQIAGEIVNKKDQLAEFTGDTIDSIKNAISNINAPKKATVKKTPAKSTKKSSVSKPAIKKAAVKKIASKSAPKKATLLVPAPSKKSATLPPTKKSPAKKSQVKKVAKVAPSKSVAKKRK